MFIVLFFSFSDTDRDHENNINVYRCEVVELKNL